MRDHHSFLQTVVPRITELTGRVYIAPRDSNADDQAEVAGGDAPPDCNGLLVGLSGGPDSVALLLAAQQWSHHTGRPVAAAHLNHTLRGGDADADAAFCGELCRRLEIPFHLRSDDPRPVARRRGCGVEEAARVLRRRFFGELLDSADDLLCVATGHHRDDQSETVVMRLFRGTGLDGLRGIQPVAGRTIHPLLAVSRRAILAFLDELGQPYRLDASNESQANTRARVRRELLPLARDIFGVGADVAPARLAELVDGDAALLIDQARRTYERLAQLDGVAVSGLVSLEPALARRVVRHAVKRAVGSRDDFAQVHVDDLLAWLGDSTSGQSLDLGGGVRATREFDRLRFDVAGNDRPVSVAENFRILVEPTSWPPAAPQPRDGAAENAAPRKLPEPVRTAAGWRLICPAAALTGALRVRNWRAGDRIEPFGLAGHTKKVSDLLRESRVPVSERARTLIVEDGSGILWVVGCAQSERTRLLPTTRRAVTLSVVCRDSGPGSAAPVDR